jgi:hypothetical protein
MPQPNHTPKPDNPAHTRPLRHELVILFYPKVKLSKNPRWVPVTQSRSWSPLQRHTTHYRHKNPLNPFPNHPNLIHRPLSQRTSFLLYGYRSLQTTYLWTHTLTSSLHTYVPHETRHATYSFWPRFWALDWENLKNLLRDGLQISNCHSKGCTLSHFGGWHHSIFSHFK